MLGLGLGLNIEQAPPYVSAQAKAFIARASIPTNQQAAYTAFINAMVGCGAWQLMDILYVFAATTQATALLNMVSASFAATLSGTVTYTAGKGFASDGVTGIVHTNFNPATQGVNYTLNSSHAALYDLTNRASGSTYEAGSFDGVSTGGGAIAVNFASSFIPQINCGAVGVASTASNGFFVGSRNSNSNVNPFKNGVLLAPIANASTLIPSVELFVGGLNSAGALLFGSTDQIASYSAGGNLSTVQVQVYNSALVNLLHSLGAI